MLIGSLSSGKPAPAICSSVKYSNKASDLMVAPTLLLLVLCYRFISACTKKDQSGRQGGEGEGQGEEKGKAGGKKRQKKTKFVKQICFHLGASSITFPLRFLHTLCETKKRRTQRRGQGAAENRGVTQINSSPPELAVCAFCTAHCNLSEIYLYMNFR